LINEPSFLTGIILFNKGEIMAEDIFRTLQKRLDMYSLGFPSTGSGVEIEILQRLFSEEDAALFLELSPLLEPPESIAQRTGMSIDDLTAQLEDMTARGLLFCLKKEDSAKYGAIPFMHGLLEFQIKRLDNDMVELFERYYDEGFKQAIIDNSAGFLRTIPVNESIDVSQQIAQYDDACEILRNVKTIVVAECICRKERGLIGKACEKPLEVCFMFGSMAQYYLDNNMGRQVDADEAIRIVKEAQEAGLVTQPATSQNPSGMCNCCGDCCGILRSVRKLPKPAEYIFSNYYACVDPDTCSGCEICLDRCQIGAVYMNDDDVAQIDLDRCIGCGLCVITCPTEALTLVRKPDGECRTPPATSAEQMMIMAQKRGITF
jgi:electron transport complex protein RnfB